RKKRLPRFVYLALTPSAPRVLQLAHLARTFLSAGSGDFPVARRFRPRLPDQEQCPVAPGKSLAQRIELPKTNFRIFFPSVL
ncbi:MAG: hypothetical protein ACLQUR_06745, partial [Limisphaerales bacterium]